MFLNPNSWGALSHLSSKDMAVLAAQPAGVFGSYARRFDPEWNLEKDHPYLFDKIQADRLDATENLDWFWDMGCDADRRILKSLRERLSELGEVRNTLERTARDLAEQFGDFTRPFGSNAA
jgi:hypothetical protein